MSTINAITYDDAVAITPSDTVVQGATKPFAAIYTGSGGTISIVTVAGTTCNLANLPAGVILPIATKQVRSSNTGATGIFGLRAPPYMGAP
jgi:hypothetical protein